MDLSIEGNVALVTASSSGFGLATAKAFAREGADVAICARTKETLKEARDEVEEAGSGEVFAVPTDLTDELAVEALINSVINRFGRLDHLVTSAGRVPGGSLAELDTDDWYDAFEILVMNTVWTIDEAAPHLKASDAGTIVTVTSASVAKPMPNLTLSNTIRRAVHGLTKDIAEDLAPEIRTNSVLPYHHVSDEDLVETSDDVVQEWTSDIPLGRVGNPDRFGEFCVFLSSDCAEYVHGTSIPLDGGWLRQ